jgi:hypothetical protein
MPGQDARASLEEREQRGLALNPSTRALLQSPSATKIYIIYFGATQAHACKPLGLREKICGAVTGTEGKIYGFPHSLQPFHSSREVYLPEKWCARGAHTALWFMVCPWHELISCRKRQIILSQKVFTPVPQDCGL